MQSLISTLSGKLLKGIVADYFQLFLWDLFACLPLYQAECCSCAPHKVLQSLRSVNMIHLPASFPQTCASQSLSHDRIKSATNSSYINIYAAAPHTYKKYIYIYTRVLVSATLCIALPKLFSHAFYG